MITFRNITLYIILILPISVSFLKYNTRKCNIAYVAYIIFLLDGAVLEPQNKGTI